MLNLAKRIFSRLSRTIRARESIESYMFRTKTSWSRQQLKEPSFHTFFANVSKRSASINNFRGYFSFSSFLFANRKEKWSDRALNWIFQRQKSRSPLLVGIELSLKRFTRAETSTSFANFSPLLFLLIKWLLRVNTFLYLIAATASHYHARRRIFLAAYCRLFLLLFA